MSTPPETSDQDDLAAQLSTEEKLRLDVQRLLIKSHNGSSDDPELSPYMPVEHTSVTNPRGTVVSFGSLVNGPGVPRKEFGNALSECGMDRLFIKDFEQVWYQHGLLGVSTTRDETTEWLGAFLKDLPRPWFFLGASSGGYAALFFGRALQADKITTFGAQTLVNRAAWGRYGGRKPWQAGFDFKDPQNNLVTEFNQAPFEGTIDLHFAAGSKFDSRQNALLGDFDNVTLHPHDHRAHNIAWYLREQGMLDSVLQNALTVGQSAPLTSGQTTHQSRVAQ